MLGLQSCRTVSLGDITWGWPETPAEPQHTRISSSGAHTEEGVETGGPQVTWRRGPALVGVRTSDDDEGQVSGILCQL